MVSVVLAAGSRLGAYELLCPLAHGGMASVWLAGVKGPHGVERLFAVKSILPLYAQDERFQAMFLDEARIVSELHHPNVATLVELGEDGGAMYLVMEFVEGDPLLTLHRAVEKKGKRIPLAIVLGVMADTCGALHAAHELRDAFGVPRNIVHRDVSPQNVMLSVQGTAKLIDFGVAKARDRAGGGTSVGDLKGKIRFMAPEQAASSEIDRRADIWAIGATIYFLLTGLGPLDGPSETVTLMRLLNASEPAPLPETIPAPVRQLVKRALTRDKAGRFSTAQEMQQHILAAMRDCRLAVSQATIAGFLAEHLADKTRERRKTITAALEAAQKRDGLSDPPLRLSTLRTSAEAQDTGGSGGDGPWIIAAAVAGILAAAGIAVLALRKADPPRANAYPTSEPMPIQQAPPELVLPPPREIRTTARSSDPIVVAPDASADAELDASVDAATEMNSPDAAPPPPPRRRRPGRHP